mgnify:CR=1 FL=1
MIFDAQDMDRSLFDRTFDVCVVGSGPAGMTLARTLAASGFQVALMEGGGLDFTEESQDLYLGRVTGLDNEELDVSRLRFFGGSSNHWYGRTRPLEYTLRRTGTRMLSRSNSTRSALASCACSPSKESPIR